MQDKFFTQYAQNAVDAMKQTGIPASVTLAQAFLESGRGQSGLTKKAFNFFGIKGQGPAGSVMMRTREVNAHGQSYYIMAPFRKYHNAMESFLDHGKFFLQNKRYAKAVACKSDPRCFANEIAKAGYATDPHYAD